LSGAAEQSGRLQGHVDFALDQLGRHRADLSGTLRKHQLKLADRQCAMAELSQRIQDLVVMLTTALYAGKQSDEIVRTAADVLCQDFKRRLTGARPTSQYFRTVTQLGEQIADGAFKSIAGLEEAGVILMPYQQ
jgi:hypothetical protein